MLSSALEATARKGRGVFGVTRSCQYYGNCLEYLIDEVAKGTGTRGFGKFRSGDKVTNRFDHAKQPPKTGQPDYLE